MGVSFRFVREMVVAALASYRTNDRSIDPTQHTFFPPSCDAAATILCWAAMVGDLHTCIHTSIPSFSVLHFLWRRLPWFLIRFALLRFESMGFGSSWFPSVPIRS